MARGSIHKHTAKDGGATWRVRVETIDPGTGKRTQPQRTFPTRRAAEAGLRAWLTEIEAGGPASPSKQTLAQYLEWWLRDCAEGRVRPTTLASYRWMCRQYAIPELGACPLARLSPQRLQGFYAALARRELSGRTRQYMHTILHTALRDGVRLGLLGRNPTDACTPPRAQRHEAAAWSPEEAQRFLCCAVSDSYWPLWLLAVHTGLRRSELLGLRWRDCDLEEGRIQIRQSLVLVDDRIVIQEGAKRGGHGLSLSGTCVDALRAHRTSQLEARLLLGPLWSDRDLVFPGKSGAPAHPSTIRTHLCHLQAAAGVPRLPFHGLRHTHATILMLGGVHPKVVSERLGHADIGITLRTYSHVLPQMEAQAAEICASALRALPAPEEQG